MRAALLAAVAAIFGICGVAPAAGIDNAPQPKPKISCKPPEKAGRDLTFRCKASDSALSFEINGREADEFWCWDRGVELSNLRVIRPGADVQDINLDGRVCQGNFASYLDLRDLNFDGVDDIVMVTQLLGPNSYRRFWIYSPATGQFVGKDEYHLTGYNLTADPKSKIISINYRSGQQTWDTGTFAWHGDQLQVRLYQLAATYLYPVNLPISAEMNQFICGSETMHFNDATLLTRIDLDFAAYEEQDCGKDHQKKQSELVLALQSHAQGFVVAIKDENHISIIFDKPKPPADWRY